MTDVIGEAHLRAVEIAAWLNTVLADYEYRDVFEDHSTVFNRTILVELPKSDHDPADGG